MKVKFSRPVIMFLLFFEVAVLLPLPRAPPFPIPLPPPILAD